MKCPLKKTFFAWHFNVLIKIWCHCCFLILLLRIKPPKSKIYFVGNLAKIWRFLGTSKNTFLYRNFPLVLHKLVFFDNFSNPLFFVILGECLRADFFQHFLCKWIFTFYTKYTIITAIYINVLNHWEVLEYKWMHNFRHK